jgi:hypothetical protein
MRRTGLTCYQVGWLLPSASLRGNYDQRCLTLCTKARAMEAKTAQPATEQMAIRSMDARGEIASLPSVEWEECVLRLPK